MTPTALKFKLTKKDRLFYDCWEYAIGFYLPEASCLRDLDHKIIDRMIERRREWRRHSARKISDSTVESLHTVCEALLTTTYQFKLVVSGSTAWVYTNHVELIQLVDGLPDLTHKEYSQAVIVRAKNTICLKQSAYTHRSYFKIAKLTTAEKDRLCSFFNNQSEHIRVSPAFEAWFKGEFLRLQDYFFIDHSGDSWLLMLALVRPGLIRKTMQIITK